MAVKPDAKTCHIKEQIIDDEVSGLTFQFERKSDDSDAPFRLKIFGNLPFGNREFLFGPNGEFGGTGTALRGSCSASWLREVTEDQRPAQISENGAREV